MTLSLLLPLRPPRPDLVAAGDGAGEDEGSDADARMRRADTSWSIISSGGSEYSPRKKGWLKMLSEGEGEAGCWNGGVPAWLSPGTS